MDKVNERTIAGVEVLEVPGDQDGPCILLFHGYGASAFDLVGLHGVFRTTPRPTWIFPNGPLEIPLGMGYVGRGWFPVDIERLTAALQAGKVDQVIEAFPPDFSEAKNLGQHLIAELNIPLSSLFIGGFSQGAVLATDIALAAEENFAGLIVLSGTLVEEKKWDELAKKHPGLPFFQSHGTQDPLLPVERAEALARLFARNKFSGELFMFRGGHEIPQSVLIALHQFFTKIL